MVVGVCLCVIVQVHVEVRLALPVVEVYKLFLQRHPEEKARIDKVRRISQPGTSHTVILDPPTDRPTGR